MGWMTDESWFSPWRGSSPKHPHWLWVHPASCSVGPGVERTGYEADHSADPLWRLRLEWSYATTHPYTSVVC